VIGPSQKFVRDNRQHSQEREIHAIGGIRIRNSKKREAADPGLRPHDQWHRHLQDVKVKVKVKWSRYRPGVAQRVGGGIALLFHARGARRGEWSAARLGRTLPPGKIWYPFYRRLGGPQGQCGRADNLVPTGIRSRTVQPIVSRYTDWAIQPIRCPEGSRRLRFPDYMTIAQDGGRVVSLRHRPLLPPGNTPGTHFC